MDRVNITPQTTVTSNPAQAGFKTSDHAENEPLIVVLEGATITATPLVEATTLPNPFRIFEADDFLFRVREQRARLEVQTFRKIYSNLVMESFPFSETKLRETRYTITLKEIIVAQVETVQLPALQILPSVRPRAEDDVDVGPQTPEPTTPKQDEVLKSDAARLYDWGLGQ